MNAAVAIAQVRFRMLINSVRREGQIWNVVSGALLALLTTAFSLGLALGLGSLAHTGVRTVRPELLRGVFLIVFWVAALLGLIVPLVFSTGGGGLDTSKLRVFPLSRRKLFSITLGSAFLSPDHVFVYPALLTVFTIAVVGPGRRIGTGVLAFALMIWIVVTVTQAVMTWVQGLLRHRRSKELLGVIGVALLMIVGLGPILLTGVGAPGERQSTNSQDGADGLTETGSEAETDQVTSPPAALDYISRALQFLPPHLAADALTAPRVGGDAAVTKYLLGLLAWAVAGTAAAYLMFVRVALKAEEATARRQQATGGVRRSNRDVTTLLPFLPLEVLGVATKELRYLLRSLIGRFNLAVMVIIVGFVALVFGPRQDTSVLGIDPEALRLYGLLGYATFLTNNVVFNSLGWEGPGVQVYLLSPTPLRRVILGKNLGLWVYCVLLDGICVAGWLVMVGFPGLSTLLTAIALTVCAMLLFVSAGNVASVVFPVARSISSLKSNPSPAAALIAVVAMLAITLVCMATLVVPAMFDSRAWTPLLLLALFLVGLVVYRVTLRFAADHFERHKERITTILDGRP